jgi:flavin reductase (DIM6/NTAB) family NADH-FMN oxidoreductase RutF
VTVNLRGAMLSTLGFGATDIAREFATSRDAWTTALPTVSSTPGTRTGALVLDLPGRLACRLRTHLPVGDHTVAIGDMPATGIQQHARPARRRRAATRGRLNRRWASTSNGRSVATGPPSLITNRCYKEYR